MYYPSEKEFLKLAGKGNLVPVYKEILADLETPVSAYLKLSRDSDYSFSSGVSGRAGAYRQVFIPGF